MNVSTHSTADTDDAFIIGLQSGFSTVAVYKRDPETRNDLW